ncbi:hypothetical protein [Massilia sp. DD77]|uniref:hypothetical protein n=1 Tax=Massilia sp. DD77 TaxID=3109349 RepID=UPI002FFF7233
MEEQQARDDDRRVILRMELIAEYQKLANAQAAFSAAANTERAEEVHRRSENIKALHREIAAVHGRQGPLDPVRPVVKLKRQSSYVPAQRASGAATFWNPYNRAPDPEISDFPTTP